VPVGTLRRVDLLERPATPHRRHPWERARTSFFAGILESVLGSRDLGRVLDIGAGDGFVAGELARRFRITGQAVCWDVNYDESDLVAPMPPKIRRVDAAPAGQFDVVLLLDVLEHVEHDAEFVDGVVLPRVAPGGLLLVSVPAHPALFSSHDVALGHYRRYRPEAIRKLLGNRLEVLREGPLFLSLVAARAFEVVVERLRPSAPRPLTGVGAWTGGPIATSVLTGALTLDGAVSRRVQGTWLASAGLTYWLCCRRLG